MTSVIKARSTRGRPVRRVEDKGGRSRLIEAARSLVLSNSSSAYIRGDVARAAGLTPALVSYYFPDHTELLECAVKPVVQQYLQEMLAVLAARSSADEKLRAIIGFLLRVNR